MNGWTIRKFFSLKLSANQKRSSHWVRIIINFRFVDEWLDESGSFLVWNYLHPRGNLPIKFNPRIVIINKIFIFHNEIDWAWNLKDEKLSSFCNSQTIWAENLHLSWDLSKRSFYGRIYWTDLHLSRHSLMNCIICSHIIYHIIHINRTNIIDALMK